MSEFKKALRPIVEAMNHYYNDKDIKSASVCWNLMYEIFDDFEKPYDEWNQIMATITDKMVYDITDYIKEQYYRKEGLI